MTMTDSVNEKGHSVPSAPKHGRELDLDTVLDEESGCPSVLPPSKEAISVPDQVDSYLVAFDGPDDLANPLNWPLHRKWVITILSSLGGVVTLMSGPMLAPAVSVIGRDLHMGDAETNLAISIFVFAYAVGPLIMAPLSEVYGRRPIWISGSVCYIVWNTVAGFARCRSLLIVSRLLSGIGSSGLFAVSAPVLSDMWRPEERGRSFAISTFLPLLGTALGPIVGGIITEQIGWHWLFWVVSTFDFVLLIIALFLYREPYAPKILSRKAASIRKTTGDAQYMTSTERTHPKLSTKLSLALSRPIRLLLGQPTIQLMSLFLAYNYGLLILVLSTFAQLWTTRYHQSVNISGLHYIALATGYTLAAQVGAPLTDRIWAHLKYKSGTGTASPEFRVPLMVPGVILIPLGLFWYGWAAEARVFWLVPDIGVGVFGFGIILGTQAMQAYVMDAYPDFTASAVAASQMLRGLAAFGFPIFAPGMYAQLGYGWGNSLLAFVFIALGVPAPLFLWKYGARVRARGKAVL